MSRDRLFKLLPLLRVWSSRAAAPAIDLLRNFALQLGLAIACTLVAHVGYRHIVADVAHTTPGYIGTEGLFMLGFVAPAIEQKDFRDTGCDADVLSGLSRPLHDPRTREYQLWGDQGLWAAMQHKCPQPEAAADIVANRAWARIPAKVLPMAFATTAQYFDDIEATWRMNSVSDRKRGSMLPLELIDITSKYFGFDVSSIAFTDTLTSVWFEHSRWWLTGCFLLAPFLAVALLWRMRRDADAGLARLLALMLIGLFLSQFLLSPVIVFRYLHPFPPMMILCATAILARLFAPREVDDREATTGSPARIAQLTTVADSAPASSQLI